MTEQFDDRKARASAWFRVLRDRIVAAFEALEDTTRTGPFADLPAGRFDVSETRRAAPDGGDAGGGLMSVMRGGRLFEKVGVNVSTVYGVLEERAQRAMAARRDLDLSGDPRCWASGISLVAHMRNPHTPAVHMNTRMFWTPQAWWFGGGSDLNPCIEYGEDTAAFHAVLREACASHGADYYDRFKAWADEYFMIRHWNEARGVGGNFYDDLDTGDWEQDFAFTQSVGDAFLKGFEPIAARRASEPWTEAEKNHQLFRRGRYAEFILVYDRGTQFGLATGHNPEAVLMALPPLAAWP